MSEAEQEQQEELTEAELSALDVEQQEQQEEQEPDIPGYMDKEAWVAAGKDPDQWVDKKTFIKRGEEYVPFIKAANKRLEEKLEKQQQTFEKFVKFQEEEKERIRIEARDSALKEIRERQNQAVSDGDTDAFKKAQADEDALRKAQEVKPQEQRQEHPDFQDWIAENKWYQEDEEAGVLADYHGQQLQQTRPDLQGRAFFDAVKSRVQKALPHKFENPNRNKAAAVESGGGRKPRVNGKTYSDLPADAKKACDEFVEMMPGYTKEQYVKDYDWSKA